MRQTVHIRILERIYPLLKNFCLRSAAYVCHSSFMECYPHWISQNADLCRREQRCVKHNRTFNRLFHRAPAHLAAQHNRIPFLCGKLTGMFHLSSAVVSFQIGSVCVPYNNFICLLHSLCQIFSELDYHSIVDLPNCIHQHNRIHSAKACISCSIRDRFLETRRVHHTVICKLNPYIRCCHGVCHRQCRLFKCFSCRWILN